MVKRQNAQNNPSGDSEPVSLIGRNYENNGTDAKTKGAGSTLVPLFISLTLDLISFTVILPLFPSLLQHYKKTDDSGVYEFLANKTAERAAFFGVQAQDIPRSETVVIGGMLGSLFCMLQFISAPIIGSISDHMGRKFALVLCLIGISMSHALWMVSWNFGVFVLARMLGGFARANVSICSTIVADDCPPEIRPKGMAMIGIAFSIGFTVGPGIGAYFAANKSLYAPALASLVFSLISLIVAIMFVKETLPEELRSRRTQNENPLRNFAYYIWPPYLFNFKLVSVGRKLKPIGFAFFFYIFIYSGLEFTLTFLTQANLKYTSADQGKMFAGIGVTMALLQGTVTRRLTPAMEPSAVMIGMLLMVPSFLIIGVCQDSVQLAFGLACYSLGSAIITPCMTSITASMVALPNEKGVALGTFRSLGSLARGFGPMASSAVFWFLGPTTAYVIGGVCIVFPLMMFKKAMDGAMESSRKSRLKRN